ncbi:unnamed protein product [Alternaria alternata]
MLLLDMPPELFDNVIHELVSLAGIDGAWKLRGVCHTFKATITYDIFAKRPVKAFTHRTWRILKKQYGLYLYYRSKAPLDIDPYLSNMVNDMVNCMAKELDKNTDDGEETVRQNLCDALQLLDHDTRLTRVIDYLVSGAGVIESWKLRGVCRTFDQEISENVLAIQPMGAFRSHLALRLLGDPENMKHYLAYHVKNPRDVFLELPTNIGEMVEYVTKELEAENDRQDRNILLEVCACVADTCRYTQDLLWTSEPDLCYEPWLTFRNEWRQKQCKSPGLGLDWHEKFIAALSVRAYGLVARLLPDAPRYLRQSVWDYPISAAVRLGDSEMITLMLDVLDQEKGKIWKRNQMLDSDSIYNIRVGVSHSITNNHAEMTALLLEYLHDYKSLKNKPCYREWVKLAIDCQNNESLKSLLQVTAEDSPYHIVNRTFEQGCRQGSLNIVKTLLKYGQVQLHSSSNTSSALAACIRSGTVDMVREVVEAGADIDYAMTTHRIARRPTITPLEYAIHIKKYDVVAYLVECGAKLPSESIWPSRGEILKVLQKAVEERKKKSKTSKAAKIAK